MTIDFQDIKKAADGLGLEPCLLQAICDVEARGSGFLADGRPKILFEGHIFWQQLKKRDYNPAGLLTREDVRAAHGDISDILFPRQGARPYGTEMAQWGKLDRARDINEDAALCSASWGVFQIMGFNFAACGYASVHDMVKDMSSGDYTGQLTALGKFLTANGLTKHLKAYNWAAFAKGYNGPGYAKNKYDTKLKAAYDKCRQAHK